MSGEPNAFTLQAPLLAIVEAKKNDFDLGVPQCAAQMYAALQYNERYQPHHKQMYGGVTTGETWLFLTLRDKQLFIDQKIYFLNELDQIIGTLQYIVEQA